MHLLDILIGFHQNNYITTEAEGQVSVCVGPINTKETRHFYQVALLPEKGKPDLMKRRLNININQESVFSQNASVIFCYRF